MSGRWTIYDTGTMLLGASLVPLSIDLGLDFTGPHSFAWQAGLLGVAAVAFFRLATRAGSSDRADEPPMPPNVQTGDPIVDDLARALDSRDTTTHRHTRRVQMYAVGLAQSLGLRDPGFLDRLRAAALLHDVGKLAMPDAILNKPGRLTASEMETMKLHAPLGADMLQAIGVDQSVVSFVRHHHESWDGAGYPSSLKGPEIPVGARILAVADCFDALTSDRPYRRRLSNGRALRILRMRRGSM